MLKRERERQRQRNRKEKERKKEAYCNIRFIVENNNPIFSCL